MQDKGFKSDSFELTLTKTTCRRSLRIHKGKVVEDLAESTISDSHSYRESLKAKD